MWKKGDIVVWNPIHQFRIPATCLEKFPGPFTVTRMRTHPSGDHSYRLMDSTGKTVKFTDAFPRGSSIDWYEDWLVAPSPFILAVWRRRHGA